MAFDWEGITSLAYLTLIQMGITSFPIPHERIKFEDIIICSYQKYSRITELSIAEISCGHSLDDAYCIKGLRSNITFILYNKQTISSRLKHTILHEVGHIKCNHCKHGEKEEIEAHFFASQVNVPNIVIKEISKRGYMINISLLTDYFGLSKESANKKLTYLKKYHFSHINEYDDILLQQFSDFIVSNFPLKTPHYYDDSFDELENERRKWY